MRRPLALLIAFLFVGCGEQKQTAPPTAQRASPSAASKATLSGGAVANVGQDSIDGRSLGARAAASAERLDVVLGQAIDEALLAEGARRRGALADPAVAAAIRATLARAETRKILDEIRSEGAYTDAEVDAVLAEHWVDLDRPETRTVLHALVPQKAADGETVAAKMEATLHDVDSNEAFLQAAKRFDETAKVGIVAESLDQPFTKEGLIAETDAKVTLDKLFCRAAFELAKPGDMSHVVKTPFGWHVIRLVSVRPPFRASREQVLRDMSPDLLRMRGKKKWEAHLEELRKAAPLTLTAPEDVLLRPRIEADPGGFAAAKTGAAP